ncbi:MAG TPA: hypothetical protein VF693_00235 [Allosphingosinicella sp.]
MTGFSRAAAALAALLAGPAAAQPADGPAPAAAASPVAAAAAAAAFRADIARLYAVDAQARQSRGGREGISGELDAFWERVKADRPTYLPLLRAELARAGNPAFFYFDGAELLRSASELREDRALALAATARADLTSIDPAGYLAAIVWYANNGFDTRAAALRFLELPRNTEIIVQPFPHVFTYSRLEAMVFTLFPMDEARFVGDLIARVQTASDDMHIFYLLHCIWASATPEGRAALAAYAEDSGKPEAARRYAREMLAHRGDGPMPSESADELRRQRRAILVDPFQHGSFERFHAITDQLVRIAS